MRVTSYADQLKRQRISDDWEPCGFERYVYQRALTRSMPLVGGIREAELAEERRYKPATSCQEELDCHCGKGGL